MRLAGLDFETANMRSGSICSAGCAVLEDGVVTESREWLVCPHKGYRWMRPDFTDIHGLTYWDVCRCSEFCDIWPSLWRMLSSADCIVCHHADFDLTHLRSVLALYDLPPVEFDYTDSLLISRKMLPELARHSLNVVAAHFGIEFRHHDAQEDAMACASIVSRLGIPDGYLKHFSTFGE